MRRFARGACPIHGLTLIQDILCPWEEEGRFVGYYKCPRRDCKVRAIGSEYPERLAPECAGIFSQPDDDSANNVLIPCGNPWGNR